VIYKGHFGTEARARLHLKPATSDDAGRVFGLQLRDAGALRRG